MSELSEEKFAQIAQLNSVTLGVALLITAPKGRIEGDFNMAQERVGIALTALERLDPKLVDYTPISPGARPLVGKMPSARQRLADTAAVVFSWIIEKDPYNLEHFLRAKTQFVRYAAALSQPIRDEDALVAFAASASARIASELGRPKSM